MFKGMVPPGRFQATCVSGAPPGPNRVLQCQNHHKPITLVKKGDVENSTVEPGVGSCARWLLGTGRGGVPRKKNFQKNFTRFYYRPAWQAQADFWEPISLRECPL